MYQVNSRSLSGNSKRGSCLWMLTLLCVLAFTACKGAQRRQQSDKVKKELPAFSLPEVPVMLQSVEARLDYVVRHYWDKFDFTDTTYIHLPDVTEQALVNYLELLVRVPAALSDSSLVQTMRKASQEENMQHYFAKTLRRYLLDPNSPLRNEELYEPIARYLAKLSPNDEALRIQARHDLKLIGMNRKGSIASDFVYTLHSGGQSQLHRIRSPYTLLVFYDPDCQGCAAMLEELKGSSILNRPDMMKRLKVLACYPDEDIELWRKYRYQIPAGWINAYDKDLVVLSNELYDLTAMPALYLLDKDKRVLLKDVSVKEVEYYFQNNVP